LSRWISLTVVNLAHPPADRPIDRLSSGSRALIQSCPTPILAVPSNAQDANLGSPEQSVLLAYDGSPKADEALYVSTYLSAQWEIPLVVVSVGKQRHISSPALMALTRAWKYLREHGVDAAYVGRQGSVSDVIMEVAQEHSSSLIVMGGYGFSPVMQIVLGSALDHVLRESRRPTLICR
jgi:nucleotide-binding universal stress UspA family protein